MAKWRPTRAQFFALGLPAESCTAPARVIATVYPNDDTLELPGHGFAAGDLVRFTATGDVLGTPAALPGGLSGALLYQAAPVGGDLFQVLPQAGGAAVNLTSAGSGVIAVVPDYLPKLDTILDAMARWCDDHAIPYAPPFDETDPPPSLVKCACELAAVKFAMVVRASSPTYSLEDLQKAADAAQVFLDKLRSGKPLAVAPKDQTPAVAEMGAVGFSRRPSRGFRRDVL